MDYHFWVKRSRPEGPLSCGTEHWLPFLQRLWVTSLGFSPSICFRSDLTVFLSPSPLKSVVLLQEKIPQASDGLTKLGRNAIIGFISSAVSDTTSNSLRVIKTTRQTFANPISYPDVIRHVIKEDGVLGLFGRGLKTRLLANGMQGLMFSVLYKYFMELQDKRRMAEKEHHK